MLHLLFFCFFVRTLLEQRLDRHQFPGQPMQAQVDLSKGTTAEDLAHFVEFAASFGHLTKPFETVGDEVG